MSKRVQLRRGTDTEHNTFTGADGEVTVDTTNKTLRVHDGTTAGGTRLATLTGGLVPVSQLPDATTSVKGAVMLNDTITSTSNTQALTAAQGKVLADRDFGVNQTYKDVTASRLFNTTYVNTTSRPIFITVQNRAQSASQGAYMTIEVNGLVVAGMSGNSGYFTTSSMSAVVSPGSSYKIGGTDIGIQRVVEYS